MYTLAPGDLYVEPNIFVYEKHLSRKKNLSTLVVPYQMIAHLMQK